MVDLDLVTVRSQELATFLMQSEPARPAMGPDQE